MSHYPSGFATSLHSSRRAGSFPLSGLAISVALLFVTFGFGPNFDLALTACVVLVVGVLLLWRPGESPIMLLAFLFQWLQSSIAVFHANWLNEDIGRYSTFRGLSGLAIELSLAGLTAFAAGMRLGAGAPKRGGATATPLTDSKIPTEKWFQLYAYLWTVSAVAVSFAWVVPGLTQPLLAVTVVKWASFFTLAYAAFSSARGWNYPFVAAFSFEFLQGIGGFFSDFKTVFFVTLLARATVARRPSAGAIAVTGSLAAVVLALGVVWTAVKGDYREYISGGTRMQTVTVETSTRLGKLLELVEQLDANRLGNATNAFIHRISYTEIFGVVLRVVPDYVPYADGAIWEDAISRPFMPRLFFPGKGIVDDSAVANRYTRGLTGTYSNTSISIGYFAESYIDFGPIFMMAPLFLFGLLCGQIYRRFQLPGTSARILGVALATSVLLSVTQVESSITKTFAALVLSTLVAWIFERYAVPRWFPWLEVKH